MSNEMTSNASRYNPMTKVVKQFGFTLPDGGIKVRAVRVGQHQGIVYQVNEEFLYTGKLKGTGEIPSWVVAVDEKDLHSRLAKYHAANAKKGQVPAEKSDGSTAKTPAAKGGKKEDAPKVEKPAENTAKTDNLV